MSKINYKLGFSYIEQNNVLEGIQDEDFLSNIDIKFFWVGIKITGEIRVVTLNTIEEVLNYRSNCDLNYRYVEYQGVSDRLLLMINKPLGSNIYFGYRAHYGIGNNWTLFFNNKRDVTVQPFNPKCNSSAYFRDFPLGDEFYVNYSCLQYTLNNYDLKTEKELISMHQKVMNRIELIEYLNI